MKFQLCNPTEILFGSGQIAASAGYRPVRSCSSNFTAK